jgi:hypothetical protein
MLSSGHGVAVWCGKFNVLASPNGRVPGVFNVDGFIAGKWRIVRGKHVATIDILPFAIVEAAVKKEVSREAEGHIRFLESDASRIVVAFRAI